jgi:hypothetical protein
MSEEITMTEAIKIAIIKTTHANVIDKANDISNNQTGIGIIKITNIIIMAIANIKSPRFTEPINISLNDAPNIFVEGCFAMIIFILN